jgi:hypothetical protein
MAELNWKAPDKDSTYNQTIIKRASSKYGTYLTIATLTNIRTTTYNDLTGTSASWAKIQFYDTVNAVYSAESNPIPYTGTVSDTNYTTPKKVAQMLNNFHIVTAEAVGTGDASTVLFGPVADSYVIADTEIVYVAGVKKNRNSDYTIDYETGKITFSAAATPALSAAITADYWASTYCLNSFYVDSIRRAEDEINRRLGRSFYQPQRTTEYIDSYDPLDLNQFAYEARGYTSLARDYHGITQEFLVSRVLKLKYFPLTSLSQVIINAQPTSVTAEAVGTGAGVVTAFTLAYNPVVYGSEIIYVSGTQSTAYTINYTTGVVTFTSAPTGAITADYTHCSGGQVVASSDYLSLLDAGIVLLKNTIPQIKKNVLICAVTYNYGFNDLPPLVERLATIMASVHLIQSTAMGAPSPQNVMSSNIGAFLGEMRSIMDSLGKKMDVIRL